MENEKETIEYKGYTIITYYDDIQVDPREDYNLGTMACFHNKYSLGDTDLDYNSDMFNGWDEMKAHIIKEEKAVVILPLWLYDHSGIAISVKTFIGKNIHAEWDSGQIGFIYATKEDIKANWMVKNVTKKLLKETERILKGEVKHYNQYIQGNVYGFIIEDAKGNRMDGCGGYIGEDYYDEMVEEAKHNVDFTVQALEDEITGKATLG